MKPSRLAFDSGGETYARPYTGTAAPDVGAESLEQRNLTTRPISAGGTQAEESASGIAARVPGVSMTLGSFALDRIPSSRYSTAIVSQSAITAAFEVM